MSRYMSGGVRGPQRAVSCARRAGGAEPGGLGTPLRLRMCLAQGVGDLRGGLATRVCICEAWHGLARSGENC